MRPVQRLEEAARIAFLLGDDVKQVAQIKIVKDDDSRDLSEKLGHTRMERGVAHIVDDAVELAVILFKPRFIVDAGRPAFHGEIGTGADDVDIVEFRQLGQQHGRIIGDAAPVGRIRRNVSQSRLGRFRPGSRTDRIAGGLGGVR